MFQRNAIGTKSNVHRDRYITTIGYSSYKGRNNEAIRLAHTGLFVCFNGQQACLQLATVDYATEGSIVLTYGIYNLSLRNISRVKRTVAPRGSLTLVVDRCERVSFMYKLSLSQFAVSTSSWLWLVLLVPCEVGATTLSLFRPLVPLRGGRHNT